MTASTLTRRAALALAAGSGALLLPRALRAAGADADPVFAAFEANRAGNPDTLAVTDAPAEGLDAVARLVHGRAPKGLAGVLYRNGPARFSRNGWRYRHWFDGDGMIQAWRIGADGAVSHRGRFVETRKWRREEAAGRFLAPTFGSTPPGAGNVASPDDINVANTSVLLAGDDLLALWEGGSPWTLDPNDLATRGPRVFRDELAGMPFSAHPKREPDGRIWNFGQDAAGERLIVWRLDAAGALEEASLVDDIPGGMIHDFAITAKSLVFLIGGLWFDRMRLPFFDSFRPDAERAMRIVALDKADLSRRRVWEAPPGFLFHIGGAWETNAGEIHVDCALAGDSRFATDGARAIMRGEAWPPEGEEMAGYARLTRFVLKARGRIERSVLGARGAEFPQIDPRRVGRARRYTWHVAWTRDETQRTRRIARRDLKTGGYDEYDYGPDAIAEEALFVPARRTAREGEGFLVATSLNLKEKAGELHVFDAMNLAAGPLATWRAPYAIPLGFHGCWRSA